MLLAMQQSLIYHCILEKPPLFKIISIHLVASLQLHHGTWPWFPVHQKRLRDKGGPGLLLPDSTNLVSAITENINSCCKYYTK